MYPNQHHVCKLEIIIPCTRSEPDTPPSGSPPTKPPTLTQSNSKTNQKCLDDSHSYAQCTDTTPTTTAGSTSLTEMGTGTAGTPHPPPQLWLENTSSTSVHYMLKSSEFLKLSGVLTRDGEPFNRPKMPTIPLEVDISKITDEETPD